MSTAASPPDPWGRSVFYAESAGLTMSTRPLYMAAVQHVGADPDDLRSRTKVGAKPNPQIISPPVASVEGLTPGGDRICAADAITGSGRCFGGLE